MAYEFTKLGSYIIAVVAYSILIQANAKVLTEEQKEQVFTEVKNCVKETGLSDDEFESIIAKKELPKSTEGKCFTKCMMEKMEYVEEGGKVNVISMQAGLEENMDKEEEITKAKAIVQQCADTVTQEDSCEYAYRITECMYNKMKEAGISAPA